MIYTAPCVRFWIYADRLRGEGGGGLPQEIESFVGPVKLHEPIEPIGECNFGPTKFEILKILSS
jgi:hypothetical protein